MEQYENIYDKIQELLGGISGNVSILEEQIDADVQLEYYNYTQNIKNPADREEVLKNMHTLFHQDLTLEAKKNLIVQMAGIDSIEAYRTLEKYYENQTQLKDWAMLAMQECRLLIESKLLDKNQILISTGLGGKGMKLRYFSVLLSANDEPYNSFHKKIITGELNYMMRRKHGELEKIRFSKELCCITSMIPLPVSVQGFFDDLIQECNNYGNFINKDYIITNVKVIPTREVRALICRSRLKNKNPD